MTHRRCITKHAMTILSDPIEELGCLCAFRTLKSDRTAEIAARRQRLAERQAELDEAKKRILANCHFRRGRTSEKYEPRFQ